MSASTFVRRGTAHLLFAVAWLIPASAWSAVPFEKALPDDCVVFVNVNDLPGLKARVRQTTAVRLLGDASMKPFVDGLAGEVDKLVALLQQRTGVDVKELASLPAGQLTFALRLSEGNPDEPPYVYLLADVSGKEAEVTRLLGRLEKAVGSELTKRSERGLTVFSRGEPKPREQLCYALKGARLLIANDPDAAAKAAEALEAGAKNSLAENNRFREFRGRASGTGDFELFIDLSRIIDVSLKAGDAEWSEVVSAFGLSVMQSAGVSLAVGKGDFESNLQILLTAKGDAPVLGLLRMPATALRPEPWVPQEIVSYSSVSWDLDKFYATLSAIIERFNPGAMAQVEAVASQFPDPNNPLIRSIKNDVIGPLGNRLTFVSDLTQANNMPVSRVLVAWQLDDGDRIRGIIDQVMGMIGPLLQAERKTIKGTTVHTFPALGRALAQAPAANRPVPVGVVALAVTKSSLFLTTHVELLDKVLNRDEGQPGLAESEGYRKVAGSFPAAVSGISYTRSDEQARAGWDLVKSGQLATLLRASLQQNAAASAIFGGLVGALEGKNLPEFDAVRKYMVPSGGFAVMDENGMRFVSFSLKQ